MGTDMKYTSTDSWMKKPLSSVLAFTVDVKPADKKAMPGDFMIEAYMTYDPMMKKWHRMEVMNDGGRFVGTSDGMKDGKLEMVGDAWNAKGQGMMKVNIDATDPKAVHIVAQMSPDKGKSWMPMIDETCKR
jgi:hypothetical protein